MGPTALLPSEERRAEDFFRPKNPTASAGCEPANLGTKGQHATSRATEAALPYLYCCHVSPCMLVHEIYMADKK
jgi:hypothetical protein